MCKTVIISIGAFLSCSVEIKQASTPRQLPVPTRTSTTFSSLEGSTNFSTDYPTMQSDNTLPASMPRGRALPPLRSGTLEPLDPPSSDTQTKKKKRKKKRRLGQGQAESDLTGADNLGGFEPEQ